MLVTEQDREAVNSQSALQSLRSLESNWVSNDPTLQSMRSYSEFTKRISMSTQNPLLYL